MKKLRLAAYILSHLSILTYAAIPTSDLIAQKPVRIASWDLYKENYDCFLSRLKDNTAVFFAVSADGQQFLRLHNKNWHFDVGHFVLVNMSVGGESFDLRAQGASTTNGWQGFTASPQENVLSALSSNDRVVMST